MFARFVRLLRTQPVTSSNPGAVRETGWCGLESMESRTLMSGDALPMEQLSLNYSKIKFEIALLLPAVQAAREVTR